MDLREYLKNNVVYLDGAMGTVLQRNGLKAGELPERWNIEHPEIVRSIHRAYFDAGSNIVNTNTFGANILKFSAEELEIFTEMMERVAANAKECTRKMQIEEDGATLHPYLKDSLRPLQESGSLRRTLHHRSPSNKAVVFRLLHNHFQNIA